MIQKYKEDVDNEKFGRLSHCKRQTQATKSQIKLTWVEEARLKTLLLNGDVSNLPWNIFGMISFLK